MAAPDLSTATQLPQITVTPGNQLSLADLTPGSSDPNVIVNNSVQGGNRLQYPADRPAYYMMMNIGVYNRKSWNEVGIINTQRTIILPLPAMIIDNQKIIYDEEPLGLVGAGVMNTLAGGATLQNAAAGAGTSGLSEGIQALGPAGQGALAAAGLAVNQFLTVMLKGPSYRQLDFIWRFSPKTQDESATLRTIIANINDAAQPSLRGFLAPNGQGAPGSAFWRFPYVFECGFFFEGGTGGAQTLQTTLFGMKRCVVANRSWNYTPANQPSFFYSRHPESVEFHLTFSELEYWLAGDYGSGLTGADSPVTEKVIDGINKKLDAAKDAVTKQTEEINPFTTPPPGVSNFGNFGG